MSSADLATDSFVSRNRGLLASPVAIGLLAGTLAWYVASADKIFQDTQALSWGEKLLPQLKEHLYITFWSTLFVVLLAIPLGVFLTRPQFRRFGAPVLAVATSGQATPAFGLIVLAFAWLGRGPWTMIWALTLFAILPVLRNTIVGLEQVDAAVIEAGRGMGLTRRQALLEIELPLAVPVILAGVRTALVINVGMAALGFLIGGGGLGITISAGLKLRRNLVLLTGAGMTAIVALTIDWIAAIVERVLRPRGL
ncbi:MAG: osmoprotectant transport system permease protein [Acidimicrobiales bacterium]|jgi:osmoprotectant transport system permease protein